MNLIDYGYSLIIFNVIVYVLLLFLVFSILFLFDLKFFRVLSEIKGFGGVQFLSLSFIFTILSLAGIPPMAGFVGKFLIFFFIFLKQHFFFLIFLSCINFFIIYFYIQNLRFLISKNQYNYFITKKFQIYLDFNLIYIIVILNFFNVFGIFFTHDFLIIINYFVILEKLF